MGIPNLSLDETLARYPGKEASKMDNDDREERDILVGNLNIKIQKLNAECDKLIEIANSRGHIITKLKSENQALQLTIKELEETESEEVTTLKDSLHQKDIEGEELKAQIQTLQAARDDMHDKCKTFVEHSKALDVEIQTLRSKYDEAVAEIAELKDIFDEETAKINLYTDLKKMVPELKKCLLANSTNPDKKELSEKPSSSAMIQEQNESKVRAKKSPLEHTESNLIPESIIPDSEENTIEPDDTRANSEQSKSNIIPDIEVNPPDAIKSKSQSRSKAKTAPEKHIDPEVIKSSLKIKPFKITDRMGRILKFLKTYPGSYNADISKGLNISTGDVSNILKTLTSEGFTTRNEDGQYYLGKQ